MFNIEIDTKGTIRGESTYNTEYDYEMNQTTGRWNAGTSLSSKKYIFSPNQEYQKIGYYSYGITRVDIQYVSKSGRDLPVIAGQTTFDLVENNGVKITCYVTAIGTITGTRTIEFEPTEE